MRAFLKGASAIVLALFASVAGASEDHVVLEKYPGQLCDQASLQRGAGVFAQYCQGCHSLQYMRYSGMGADIGIVDRQSGELLEQIIKDNLNFVSDKVTDPMVSAISRDDAQKWFGVAPPDLTLIARVRGTDWLYSYLKGFYADPSRPWGVNNAVFPDVGMPHILLPLQGKQAPVYKTVVLQTQGETVEQKVIDHLELVEPGSLDPQAYDQLVTDLVNFLDYAAEPVKLERERMGVWVILFLVVFLLFAWLLKREYWKDIH